MPKEMSLVLIGNYRHRIWQKPNVAVNFWPVQICAHFAHKLHATGTETINLYPSLSLYLPPSPEIKQMWQN